VAANATKKPGPFGSQSDGKAEVQAKTSEPLPTERAHSHTANKLSKKEEGQRRKRWELKGKRKLQETDEKPPSQRTHPRRDRTLNKMQLQPTDLPKPSLQTSSTVHSSRKAQNRPSMVHSGE
jgi:hypothetical protein